jgi:16S rRNA (uracil1498-N3)-methyltransferase
MKNKIKNNHTFALFYSSLPLANSWSAGCNITIIDQQLWHRITSVLRLSSGEHVVLFDAKQHLEIELNPETFKKKNIIHATVITINPNTPLTPTVILMLALLKKEAFETVAYLAAQIGATHLQPLITTKIQREWGKEKELARLTNIMIAAAEQSKNFVLPIIYEPVPLTQLDENSSTLTIFFEDTGTPLISIIKTITETKPQTIRLVFGPEGGLTSEEQHLLISKNFLSCALTQTTLRSQEAVAVGLGIIRSLKF